jgi:hypothetical protein
MNRVQSHKQRKKKSSCAVQVQVQKGELEGEAKENEIELKRANRKRLKALEFDQKGASPSTTEVGHLPVSTFGTFTLLLFHDRE